ncbi:MAG: signal peptide peptidase SppA [Sedimentisphaerales bacterium]|nr:signal peptide peptidase SppA [Sedimentisphaerales bacterium]
MDYERNDDLSQPSPPPPSEPPIHGLGANVPISTPPPRKRSGWRIFWGILLTISVMANIALFLMLIGVVAVLATGHAGILTEEVVREGPATQKIAVVAVEGIIHGPLAEDVYAQLKAARQDRHVKGLIIRVNSPGGTISASDRIYKEIRKFREERGMPVIAFMQGVAASGGYYASVACDKIIAEPTTITGSIGVISSYFVVQELLEDKLGVMPVTIKSGQKKDWPSSFRKPSEEELTYMREKVMTPAFERFVDIVVEGRKASLDPNEVRELADGGIFGAQEAVHEKLIDGIGYLDEAIQEIKSLAGIQRARVVEYRKPFSLADMLSMKKPNLLKLNRDTLYDLATPQIMYLWSAY